LSICIDDSRTIENYEWLNFESTTSIQGQFNFKLKRIRVIYAMLSFVYMIKDVHYVWVF